MCTGDVFKNGFSTYGPEPVNGHPGLYRVTFIPRTLMAVRGVNQPAPPAPTWEAVIIVDSRGAGAIIEHKELTPPVAELNRADFEARALELVREFRDGQGAT